ncbi:uncharacterized protein J7T54_000419 [Emericellopsis cladophorae]|uniref:Uncharacterized protein n=1 Tax=Emericellopsis cladophorae TaxID=2686198 RepID=A0A9P9XWW0_9HYPO|nr:uncharacterized protein J7T54_000419 [Emericellopsis cladophorae]KAI6779321.1 hypothetical protein J7T54_000419 [Emericellopsis cladophorae]
MAPAADDASEYTVFDKDVSSVQSKTDKKSATSKTERFLSKFKSSSPSSKTPKSDHKPNWEARATHGALR